MTTKTSEVVKDALQKILVLAAEEPIQQADAILAMRVMNGMMTQMTVEGINLGYSVVEDLGDLVTVPDGAIQPIKDILASKLFPYFYPQASEPNAIAIDRIEGKKTLLHLGVSVSASEYPDTVPRGQGNEDHSSISDDHFYPTADSTVAAESEEPFEVEDGT